jgi:electron transport complex protein RnfG
MADIIKLGIFLMLVAAVAGLGVGYVNTVAAPLIERQMLKEKIESFKEVYPSADKVENESAVYLKNGADPALKEINIAYKNSQPAGVLYLVQSKGYSGLITILAGFDIATEKITAIKVLSQSETPGLGAKAKDPKFQNLYRDKNARAALEVVKTEPIKENQIQAITASTITSKAVTKGINLAREHFVGTFVAGKKN